jgi:hypothetical protein
VTSREERVARNETAAREINEGIEQAHAKNEEARYFRILCECGKADCEQVIGITRSEYEQVRSDPVRFVVRRDHVDPSVEDIVSETDRFVVVAKREGIPAEVAEEEDPRQ